MSTRLSWSLVAVLLLWFSVLASGCEIDSQPAVDEPAMIANDIAKVARQECRGTGSEYCEAGFSLGANEAQSLNRLDGESPSEDALQSRMSAAEDALLDSENELFPDAPVGPRAKTSFLSGYRAGWEWYLARA